MMSTPNFKIFKIILEKLSKKTVNQNFPIHSGTFLRSFILL